MPVRQRPEKKVEGGPQGSDAFVVVKRLTVEEANSFTERMAELRSRAIDAESRKEGELEARKAISELIFSWNWVNNDNQPLAQPHNNPDVMGELYTEELTWLTEALANNTQEQQDAAKKKRK